MTVTPRGNGQRAPRRVDCVQGTLFDVSSGAPTPEQPPKCNELKRIRDDFNRARGIALGRLETVEDSIELFADVGRLRERIAAFELRLRGVEQTLRKFVLARTEQVRGEREIVRAIASVLEGFLSPTDHATLCQMLVDADLVGVGRALADPANLSEAMNRRSDESDGDETTALVAGLIHDWEWNDAEHDPDLDGLDLDAD